MPKQRTSLPILSAMIGASLVASYAASDTILGAAGPAAHAALVTLAPTSGDTARHSLEFLVARGLGQ